MFGSTLMMWVVFGAASAYMARARGKNPILWFFLGMLFGIFGLIFLFFSPKPKARTQAQTDPNTIDITPKLDPAHKDKLWYYLDGENKQQGPMSFDALSRAFQKGPITLNSLVWNESLSEWQPLSDFLK